jgi:hypothetical protein
MRLSLTVLNRLAAPAGVVAWVISPARIIGPIVRVASRVLSSDSPRDALSWRISGPPSAE